MKTNVIFSTRVAVLVAALLVLWSGGQRAAAADVFELKTGNKIEGDVLKQQGDVLFVDIGIEVVKVPLSQIKTRTASKESANVPVEVHKHKLYRTAELPRRSVKDLTEK